MMKYEFKCEGALLTRYLWAWIVIFFSLALLSWKALAAAGKPTYVYFQGLSAVGQSAEIQKDIILPVLTHSSRNEGLFIDASFSQAAPTDAKGSRYLIVKCEQCPFARATQKASLESLEIMPEAAIAGRTLGERMTFLVEDLENGQQKHWKLQVKPAQLRWHATLGKPLQRGETFRPALVSVETCLEGLNCPKDVDSFSTETEALEQLSALDGKVATRAISSLKKSEFSALQSPVWVRSGDVVKVTLGSQAQSLQIKTQGRAKQAGAQGDKIWVELPPPSFGQKSKNLQVTVQAPGEVRYDVD
jgi:hypothetical protein